VGMGQPVIAALDVGTTAAKAALVAKDGAIVATASRSYETQTGPGGVTEQGPEDWWAAACEAMRACEPGRFAVVALGLTGQMQDLIAVGPSGPLRPAILYSDTRAKEEAARVERAWGAERWWAVTGNLQDASSLPAKLLWLKRHEPQTYRQTRWVLLGAHDYIAWRTCGAAVTDLTTASTTGLLELSSGRWATALLEALDLRTDFLPDLAPAWSVTGHLMPEAAQAMGLPAGIPVVHGAGDAATATLGAGAGGPGGSYLYLGTSGWLALTSPGGRAEPTSGVFTLRHPEPAWTLLIGPLLMAAGNLEWLRRQLGEAPYEALEALARSAPPGSGGVLYLPYLAGERSPFRNPRARAAFLGIGAATGRAELVRSVMEGVAFALRSVAEAMPQPQVGGGSGGAGGAGASGGDTGEVGPIGAAGGGCRSDLWCEIIAAVLRRPLHRLVGAQDVGIRGAAILAGRAMGWFDSFVPGPGFFPVDRVFVPDDEAIRVYDGLYREFIQRNPYLAARAASEGVR